MVANQADRRVLVTAILEALMGVKWASSSWPPSSWPSSDADSAISDNPRDSLRVDAGKIGCGER